MTSELIRDRDPAERELDLLRGFVDPIVTIPHGLRKVSAAKLRARIAAVSVVQQHGPKVPLKLIASMVGRSERNLYGQFGTKEALLAFPPPEMAQAMGSMVRAATSWAEVGELIRPLFVCLNTNPDGLDLMAGLSVLYDEHRSLRQSDGYFADELRNVLAANESLSNPGSRRKATGLIGLFTDELRAAISEWAQLRQVSVSGESVNTNDWCGEVNSRASIVVAADAISSFIANPPTWVA
jgi:hypothetical protein